MECFPQGISPLCVFKSCGMECFLEDPALFYGEYLAGWSGPSQDSVPLLHRPEHRPGALRPSTWGGPRSPEHRPDASRPSTWGGRARLEPWTTSDALALRGEDSYPYKGSLGMECLSQGRAP